MGKSNKGKNAEYAVVKKLKSIGFEDARRVTLSGWGQDLNGDVIFAGDIKGEVKAKQSLIPKTLIEAKGDCHVLFIKPDGTTEPLVFMDWKGFCKVLGK